VAIQQSPQPAPGAKVIEEGQFNTALITMVDVAEERRTTNIAGA
jgi:hypothetical protein